jgi:hypothetical protein
MQFQELQANNIVFIKEYAYISNMHVESLLCKDSKRHPPLSDSAFSYNEWKILYSQVWEEQYVFSVLQSVTFRKMTEGIWEKKKRLENVVFIFLLLMHSWVFPEFILGFWLERQRRSQERIFSFRDKLFLIPLL